MSHCPYCGATTYYDMESPCASIELWECGTRYDSVVGDGYMQSQECERREGTKMTRLAEQVRGVLYDHLNGEKSGRRDNILAILLQTVIDDYEKWEKEDIAEYEETNPVVKKIKARARQRLKAWFGLGPSPPPPGTD